MEGRRERGLSYTACSHSEKARVVRWPLGHAGLSPRAALGHRLVGLRSLSAWGLHSDISVSQKGLDPGLGAAQTTGCFSVSEGSGSRPLAVPTTQAGAATVKCLHSCPGEVRWGTPPPVSCLAGPVNNGSLCILARPVDDPVRSHSALYHGCLPACLRAQLSVTPWTVARQAPLSMDFSKQEHWSGLITSIS